MTSKSALRWLKEQDINATYARIRFAHESGYVPWPERNDSGDYSYSEFDLIRLRCYFQDRAARPGAWKRGA